MQRRGLFETPIFLERDVGTPALRTELRDRILAESRNQPGMKRSNVGGWHSEQDLLTRKEPCYRQLTELVVERYRMVLQNLAKTAGKTLEPNLQIGGIAWAMVMEGGHYSSPHHHGEAHWAAVYYVDAGDQPTDNIERAGCLTFIDPRGGVHGTDPQHFFLSAHDLRPVDGLLVFFPGWLTHMVHPYTGTRPRVSISCNLQVT